MGLKGSVEAGYLLWLIGQGQWKQDISPDWLDRACGSRISLLVGWIGSRISGSRIYHLIGWIGSVEAKYLFWWVG
jgi:hypothetical protein